MEVRFNRRVVSSATWIKHARVSFSKTIKITSESEGRVQFDVFEKLTSLCFSKLDKEP
jgi:hypothetical protein